MAGTPADLTVYKDSNKEHDHTYYGRGCNDSWGTGSGSNTPCTDSNGGGRFVSTVDNETQKNGTYYHFHAATSGSGGPIITENAKAPDSFCPLGWQLPYSGTGGDYYDQSKSWKVLFTTYNIKAKPDALQESITIQDKEKILSYPLSYINSGLYYWSTGLLYLQTQGGFYWSSIIASENPPHAYRMTVWHLNISRSETVSKYFGNTLRCVDYLASPHRRHGGRNKCRAIPR